MTDMEIVKALECCKSGTTDDCKCCPRIDGDRDLSTEDCMEKLMHDALALINRQKAEIERVEAENEEQHQAIINALHRMGEIRAEAVKEFADKLKANILHKSYPLKLSAVGEIDNLVKEFTGGGDADRAD